MSDKLVRIKEKTHAKLADLLFDLRVRTFDQGIMELILFYQKNREQRDDKEK